MYYISDPLLRLIQQGGILLIIVAGFVIYPFFKKWKGARFISKNIVPFIIKLEQQCSAKFPILIDDGDSDLPDWQPPKHNGNSYAFILDDKVVIKSSLDSDLNIEIPYSEITYTYIPYTDLNNTYGININACNSFRDYKFEFSTTRLNFFKKKAFGKHLYAEEFVRELKSLGK